jgi:hypothetical protein
MHEPEPRRRARRRSRLLEAFNREHDRYCELAQELRRHVDALRARLKRGRLPHRMDIECNSGGDAEACFSASGLALLAS